MIFNVPKRTRMYRRLSRVIGYIVPTRRMTSRVIPVAMNAELKELHANRRALLEMYSNRPDPDWIGASSPDSFCDEANNA